MELTKQSKKVLKVINSSQPDFQDRFYTVEYISQLSKVEDVRLRVIIRLLQDNGLVEYADNFKSCLRLLEPGIRYKEIKRIRSRKIWGERIWTFVSGLAMGLITGLVIGYVLFSQGWN